MALPWQNSPRHPLHLRGSSPSPAGMLQCPDLPTSALGEAAWARGAARTPAERRLRAEKVLGWGPGESPLLLVFVPRARRLRAGAWHGAAPGRGREAQRLEAQPCRSPGSRPDEENMPFTLLFPPRKAVNPFRMLHLPNFWMPLNSLLIYSKCLRSYSSAANPIKRIRAQCLDSTSSLQSLLLRLIASLKSSEKEVHWDNCYWRGVRGAEQGLGWKQGTASGLLRR